MSTSKSQTPAVSGKSDESTPVRPELSDSVDRPFSPSAFQGPTYRRSQSIFKSFFRLASEKIPYRQRFRRKVLGSEAHAYAFSLPSYTDRPDTSLPVAAICMLLAAEFSLHYLQRLLLTWLSHLIDSIKNRRTFGLLMRLLEFASGPASFMVGIIADSYTGKYWPIFIGSVLAVFYTLFCFAMSYYHELAMSQTLIVLLQMPILHIFGGVRWAYFMEQVSIPRHLIYLETHVFLATFIRNFGRSCSVFVYVFISANYEDPYHGYTFSTLVFALVNLILIMLCKKRAFSEKVYRGIVFKAYHYFGYCVIQKYKNRHIPQAKKMKLFDYGRDQYDIYIMTSGKQLIIFPIIVLPFIFNTLMRGSLISIWDMQQRYVWRPLEPDITMTELYNYASVLFLPFVHFCFKPLMRKLELLTQDIHYISLGYLLLCFSIATTSVTHFITDTRGGYLYEGKRELILYNGLNTTTIFKSDWFKEIKLPPRSQFHMFGVTNVNETIIVEILNAELGLHAAQSISVENGKLTGYLIEKDILTRFSIIELGNRRNSTQTAKVHCCFSDQFEKSRLDLIFTCDSGKQHMISSNDSCGQTQIIGDCTIGIYDSETNKTTHNVKGITLEEGGAYGFFLYNNKKNVEIFTLVQPAFKSYVLYPQLLFAVLGDCITVPALMKFSYLVAPRKVRSTIFSFGFLADGIGEGVLGLVDILIGGANTTVLNIWALSFFVMYFMYIFLILHINYQENIGNIGDAV